MPKRIFVILLAVLVLAFASVPTFAADGSGRGVLSWFSDVGGFIRDIFVPDGNYFNNQLSRLNRHINSRFAGLGELYQMIDSFYDQQTLTDHWEGHKHIQQPDNIEERRHGNVQAAKGWEFWKQID